MTDQLKEIQRKFHSCLDRLLLKEFEDMTPAQLVQYQISHPENESRVEEYISSCSKERQEKITEEFVKLEEFIRYGDF